MGRILIVTPTFRSETYLEECIQSIVSQAGDHEVRYHIQDGGSDDGTWDIICRWRDLLAQQPRLYPGRVVLTAEQAPDAGMYDAIMKGFAHLRPRAGDLMTWLNSDDLLAHGAFRAVTGCMADNPEVAFCGGRVALIDPNSRLAHMGPPLLRPQRLMAAGLYDGRSLPFVMQEGVFWTASLWKAVGGLDRSFRLAGDWDLWRRMAEHEPFVALDALTGFHRRRPGQLSGDMDAYYREVDAKLKGEVGARYRRTHDQCHQVDPDDFEQIGVGSGLVATFDLESQGWILAQAYGEAIAPSLTVTWSDRRVTQRCEVVRGARAPEGPYPDQGLPSGIRWITDPQAVLRLTLSRVGKARVRLICRPGASRVRLTLMTGGEVLIRALISPQTPERDHVIEFDLWADAGECRLTLHTETLQSEPELRLLLVDATYAEIEADDTRGLAEADVGDGSIAIAISCRSRPNDLARTLESLADQTRRAAAVTVVLADSDAVSPVILDSFRQINVIIVADEDVETEAWRRLDSTRAPLRMALRAGDELAPEALEFAARAFGPEPSGAVTGFDLQVDEIQRQYWRPWPDVGAPVVLAADAWRRLVEEGSEDGRNARSVMERLADSAAPVRCAPIAMRRTRGRPAMDLGARVLWLRGQDASDDDAFGGALGRMGFDVRRVDLPTDRRRAARSAVFHDQAWNPAVVFITSEIAEILGKALDKAVRIDAAMIDAAQFADNESTPGEDQSILVLTAQLIARIGQIRPDLDIETILPRVNRLGSARIGLTASRAAAVEDAFGARVSGFSVIGFVSLADDWTARAGFGAERSADPAMKMTAPYRWIESQRAVIGVFNRSAGRRRLTLWMRSPANPQRVILSCGGRLVHEAAIDGRGALDRDARVVADFDMAAGWNEVELRFSSSKSSGNRDLVAIITALQVSPARRRPVAPLGDWHHVQGADFEEPPYPQYGLHRRFRWSLEDSRIHVTPQVPGRNRVTILYRSTLAGQTLTARRDDEVLVQTVARSSELSVLNTLTFSLDLTAEGAEIQLQADRFMQDGRKLAFIIDEVRIEAEAGEVKPSVKLDREWIDRPARFLRRVARAIRRRLNI